MPKHIQIEYELFLDIYDYFFGDEAPEDFEADNIRRQLDQRVDKIINRELFSRYKRTPSGSEREKARQEYLDRRGITKGYRTPSEWHMEEPPPEEELT